MKIPDWLDWLESLIYEDLISPNLHQSDYLEIHINHISKEDLKYLVTPFFPSLEERDA